MIELGFPPLAGHLPVLELSMVRDVDLHRACTRFGWVQPLVAPPSPSLMRSLSGQVNRQTSTGPSATRAASSRSSRLTASRVTSPLELSPGYTVALDGPPAPDKSAGSSSMRVRVLSRGED